MDELPITSSLTHAQDREIREMEATRTTSLGTEAMDEREIIFSKGPANWIMKLTPQGIKFNHEDYPNLTENEFAENIIQILENCYDIIFIKKD